MKIRLSLFCIAMAFFAFNVADAQVVHSLHDGGYSDSAYQQVSGDLLRQPGMPGRLWFEANVADQGLGYTGKYLTIGGKSRLFEDRLDGRWLMEGQIHHSIEDEGGLFANIGIERVFSIPAAGANVTVGAFYDYDGDRQGDFAHTFHQVGVSGSIKTQKWDVIGNGYFPTGVQDYSFGDPSGANCFVGHSIVTQAGIDSALQGFDVTLRLRPKQIAFANGTVDFGGYHYNSDLVDAFGGGRVRLGFQMLQGMMVSAEVNHDNRFDTTGVLSVGWLYGANASGYGSEYAALGRDLEQSVRNDHIVRFNQEVILAIDPTTGVAYNVVHVNNTADPGFEDGSAERPYTSLWTAQNLSAEGDVILVNAGDGTDRNMDQGITLQNNQRLWGNGQSLLIPIQNGQLFELCTNPSGLAPTISNGGGFAAITLANNNDVAGINVDATGATFGIWGNGDTGSLRNNTVSNANLDGVRLSGITGDWNIQGNTFSNNTLDGIYVLNAMDTTAELNFRSNLATQNGADGIHLRNYDPGTITFLSNNTSSNVRNGLNMENYLNSSPSTVQIINHTANNNAETGVFVNRGAGNLSVLDSNVNNNGGAGVMVRNWATANPEMVLIGTTENGTSNILGNGSFANVQFVLDDPGVHTRAVVTNQSLNNGIRGVGARVQGISGGGIRSTLDIDILDNIGINNNVDDGIRLAAINSGLIRARIGSTVAGTLQNIVDNANGGGDGISFAASGINGQPAGEIQAVVRSVFISNQLSTVFTNPGILIVATDGIGIDSFNNGLVDITVDNATIGQPNNPANRQTQNGVRMNLNNNGSNLVNRVSLNNLRLFNDIGVSLITGTSTYSDLVLTNSVIRPDGIQSTAGVRGDDTPFTDGIGSFGVFVQATGQAVFSGQFNTTRPNSEISPFEVVSDGTLDNLTRIRMEDNSIQDFTFNGVNIQTFGDAQLLVEMDDNDVSNNGAGFNDDTNNNNVYNDPTGGIADPDNLFFYDGVNIDAFDQSTISARLSGNVFRDNFERGLSLNTFSSATMNAVVGFNTFFGNDRGEDNDNNIPIIANGQVLVPLGDSGFADFEAINNEEFYIRAHEAPVLYDNNGAVISLGGVVLPAGVPGVFYPGNVGVDIFGTPVALGVATMNVDMTRNALQLGPDIIDFAVAPGDFQLGLDGITNGFTGPFPGVTPTAFGSAEVQVIGEETFFNASGF